ncbi:MAG: hypothetical protein C9356_11840 [Oleiphilus sp.]|nr:MAG: hypothetical protein C9356_11840 [Oleiphilus sp.]
MGATVFTEIRLFTCTLEATADQPGENEGLMMFVNTYEKNCYPHIASWRLQFVGTQDQLITTVLPCLMDQFDDGISQGPIANNGTAFKHYLLGLLTHTRPVEVEDLMTLGFRGYSYSEREYQLLGSPDGFHQVAFLNDKRWAHPIADADDINGMASAVVTLRGSGKWWYGLPYKVSDFFGSRLPQPA